MILLIDIGNSRLKWAIENNGQFIYGKPINHQKGTFDCSILENEWKRLEQPSKVVVSNVAGQNIAEIISDIVWRLWQQSPYFAQSTTQQFGLSNGYTNPSQLGVDRWVAMLGAVRHYSLPACIIDCGSATTVDVIDANGFHLGGVIAPGIDMMKQSIIQGTDQINKLQIKTHIGLSNDTLAAVHSGVLFSIVGLIDQVVTHELSDKRINLKSLLISGGDAKVISNRLKRPAMIDLDLIFKGLLILGKEDT